MEHNYKNRIKKNENKLLNWKNAALLTLAAGIILTPNNISSLEDFVPQRELAKTKTTCYTFEKNNVVEQVGDCYNPNKHEYSISI